MYQQIIDNLRKAADSAFQVQQEMFKNCINCFPGVSAEQLLVFQKKGHEAFSELLKKQRDLLEAELNAGLTTMEDVFRVSAVKLPEEFAGKVVDYWQKSFDCVRRLADAQISAFQVAGAK
jgi:hypothetical protein